MSFVYGGYRPNHNEPFEFFSVQVEVLEQRKAEPDKINSRSFWPHYPVVFKRMDTGEEIARIGVPTMQSLVLDDSNVFDLLEYCAYNFGTQPPGPGVSPYDIKLRLAEHIVNEDPYSTVVLKRAVGCRHFVFHTNGKQFHVTVHGQGFVEHTPRHDVSDLLFVRSDANMGSWTAGTDTYGFKLTLIPNFLPGAIPQIYSIPFAHTPSAKETSKIQITGIKKYIENPNVFANPQFGYDPHLFKKHVVSEDFWYLKSGDAYFIITLIKDPSWAAMKAVFDLMKTLDKEGIARFGSIYCEWMAKATLNNKGKNCEKEIIIYSIEMVEKIQEHIREKQEA